MLYSWKRIQTTIKSSKSITFWRKGTDLILLFLENVWPQVCLVNDLWKLSALHSVSGTNASALPISVEGQGPDTLDTDPVHYTHTAVLLCLPASMWQSLWNLEFIQRLSLPVGASFWKSCINFLYFFFHSTFLQISAQQHTVLLLGHLTNILFVVIAHIDWNEHCQQNLNPLTKCLHLFVAKRHVFTWPAQRTKLPHPF